jgi:hypothetical protein
MTLLYWALISLQLAQIGQVKFELPPLFYSRRIRGRERTELNEVIIAGIGRERAEVPDWSHCPRDWSL